MGVIVGIAAVSFTGWLWLDPVLALLVAANIIWTGGKLLLRSTHGLMDCSLPVEDHARVVAILDYRSRGVIIMR